jgi:hypothetical protein
MLDLCKMIVFRMLARPFLMQADAISLGRKGNRLQRELLMLIMLAMKLFILSNFSRKSEVLRNWKKVRTVFGQF